MIRPGTGSTSSRGRNTVWSTPDRHDGHPLGVHAHLGGDVGLGRLRHGDDPGERPGHLDLHAQEAEPSPLAELLPRVGGVAEGQLAVDGDRVVERLEDRPAVLHHPLDAVAEALVVVDEVELVAAGGQHPAGPQAERPRLGEPGGAHDAELEGGDRGRVGVQELAAWGTRNGSGLAVEVEARDRGEADPLVDLGPRLAGEDLHRVAECHQLAGQVAGVDALATAARVAPVDEEGDAEAARRRRPGRDALGDRRRLVGPLDPVAPEPEARHGGPAQEDT